MLDATIRPSSLIRFTEFADDIFKRDKDSDLFELEPLFDVLVTDTNLLCETLNAEVSKISRFANYDTTAWNGESLLLAEGKRWTLSYGLCVPTTGFIVTQAAHLMFAVVGNDPLIVRRYRADKSIDNDVFDPDVSLEQIDEYELRRGGLHSIDSRVDIDAFDTLGKSVHIVKLRGRIRREICWAFSKLSQRAAHPLASAPTDIALITYIRALAALNNADSVPFLNVLTEHPSHFVRWTALQALLRLNPGVGNSSLHRAANDAHPHIQQASLKAIASLRG